MSISDERVKDLLVEISEEENVAASTTGVFVQRLEHQYDVEMERSEVRDLLEELREEGIMKYHLGEFGEFALVDE
jgi:transposase